MFWGNMKFIPFVFVVLSLTACGVVGMPGGGDDDDIDGNNNVSVIVDVYKNDTNVTVIDNTSRIPADEVAAFVDQREKMVDNQASSHNFFVDDDLVMAVFAYDKFKGDLFCAMAVYGGSHVYTPLDTEEIGLPVYEEDEGWEPRSSLYWYESSGECSQVFSADLYQRWEDYLYNNSSMSREVKRSKLRPFLVLLQQQYQGLWDSNCLTLPPSSMLYLVPERMEQIINDEKANFGFRVEGDDFMFMSIQLSKEPDSDLITLKIWVKVDSSSPYALVTFLDVANAWGQVKVFLEEYRPGEPGQEQKLFESLTNNTLSKRYHRGVLLANTFGWSDCPLLGEKSNED